MEVVYTKQALKDLIKIPHQYHANITARIEGLSNGLQGDIQKLAIGNDRYRLRVGSYRVFLLVTKGMIKVIEIKHRQGAY